MLRQETIGRYGILTVEDARQRAKKLLGKAAGGGDPLGERKAARQSGVTVAEICDWYLRDAEVGRLLGRRGKPIKKSTLALDRSRIETHVKPLVGRMPVSTITLADLERMQADIAAGKTARVPKSAGKTKARRTRGGVATGGSGVAARTLGMLQTILEHSRRAGMIAINPARGARKLAGSRRRKRLSLDQMSAFGTAMRETTSENPVAISALRFILLSGFRRNEALSIRAEQLTSASGVDLPDSKSGPQVRAIGRSAMAVLRSRASEVGDLKEAWLFPAERGDGHFIGLPKVLARVCRLAKLDGITIHTLRHSFASIAGDIGYSELVIAGLLGHSAGSVTSSYVHLDKALVAAADQIASTIAAVLDGNSRAEVIQLRPASA